MLKKTQRKFMALYIAGGLPIVLAQPAFAETAGVNNVENFIKSVILIMTAIAGFIAAGALVMGGIGYITSSGNPENLTKSKHTIVYSLVGLSIAIGAFVICNIVSSLATNAFGG